MQKLVTDEKKNVKQVSGFAVRSLVRKSGTSILIEARR